MSKRRRLETLPFAALMLERLLRTARPDAHRVLRLRPARGPSLRPALAGGERRQDPLIAACPRVGRARRPLRRHRRALDGWIAPLFPGDDASARRLRLAACLLSDIGWREHPDYRAEQAFARILRLPIAGIDHGERVFIAAAICVRYGGELEPIAGDGRPADHAQRRRSRLRPGAVLGLALRLAYSPERRARPPLLRETSRAAWATRDRLTCCCRRSGGVCSARAVDRASRRWPRARRRAIVEPRVRRSSAVARRSPNSADLSMSPGFASGMQPS